MSELSAVQRKFVLHWGEMGNRWGINRTMAQVHALLYLSAEPLHAEHIQDTLQVARSNVSNCLRELQGWGVVRVVHVLGDRRDHFETLSDVWELFRVVLEERKRREIDPTLAILEECIAEAEQAGKPEQHTRERLEAMREFFTTVTVWYSEVSRLPQPALRGFLRMGSKLKRMLSSG
ncbi:MAG: ArsR family transcriptional regulator [Planctomycetota bacterium]|jgi:DNA-binding transcriptional regulator GbsR (MarR family)|nr:ArsR family transcriptional regulator [Planctomycetota bacterium]